MMTKKTGSLSPNEILLSIANPNLTNETIDLTQSIKAVSAEALFAAACDEVAKVIIVEAKRTGKNPACLVRDFYFMLGEKIPSGGIEILRASSEILNNVDPTKEAGTAHDICTPWTDEVELPNAKDVLSDELVKDAVHNISDGSDVNYIEFIVAFLGARVLDIVVEACS